MTEEQIIMQSIVVAIITAATTLLGVVLVEILFGRKTYKLLDLHSQKSESIAEKNHGEHDDLSKEHDSLSHEHEVLSGDHKVLLERAANLSADTKVISTNVQAIGQSLSAAHAAEQVRYDNLTDKQRSIKDSIDKLKDFSGELERVNLKNVQLQNELELTRKSSLEQQQQYRELYQNYSQLLYENAQLKERLSHLEQQPKRSPRGMEPEM